MIALQENTTTPTSEQRRQWAETIIAHPSLMKAAGSVHRWVSAFRQDVEVADLWQSAVASILENPPQRKPADFGAAAYVMGRERMLKSLCHMRYARQSGSGYAWKKAGGGSRPIVMRKPGLRIEAEGEDGSRVERFGCTDDVHATVAARELYRAVMRAAPPKVAALIRLGIEGHATCNACRMLGINHNQGAAMLDAFLSRVRSALGVDYELAGMRPFPVRLSPSNAQIERQANRGAAWRRARPTV